MQYASTLHFPRRNAALAAKAGAATHQRQKCLLLMGLMMAFAAGAQTAVAQEIDKCGTVITAPGNYTVDRTLYSTSPTEDCISIQSSGVSLIIGENSTAFLVGPGGTGATGAGIRIGRTTKGVLVSFGKDTAIEDFGVGIVVQGSGAALTSFNGSSIYTAINAAQGVLISDATNVLVNGLRSHSNGAAGLELEEASGVIVQGNTELVSNGGHGLWVHSSSGNQFFNVNAATNKQDGIYLGEVPGSQQPGSVNNLFVGGYSTTNLGPGVTIGTGDTHNVVTSIEASGNKTADLQDRNGNCVDNSWSKNKFQVANPSCIQ
jgi:Right handed beta helix region